MKRLILLLSFVLIAGCSASKAPYVAMADEAMKAPTHEEAVKIYETGVKKSVHSHLYYSGRGDIHYKYGYYGEAVNDYTRALRNFGRPEYNLKRGRAYMKLHFYKDALIDFTSVVEMDGKRTPVAYVERAKARVAMGDFKDAAKDLEKAEKRGIDDTEFLVAMGELNFKMGHFEDSKTYIQKAIIGDSGNSDLYLLRAKVFYKEKDANQAITDLKKAMELDAENPEAKRMLAWIYATNPLSAYRNGAEALKLAKELYSRDEDTEYVEVLAAAYAELGEYDEAINVLNKGIRNTPDLVRKEDFRFDIETYKKGEPVRTW